MQAIPKVELCIYQFLSLGRYWETVQRLGITHFCSTPSSIQQLMKAGDGCVLKYDRSKLKVLITGWNSNLSLNLQYSGVV